MDDKLSLEILIKTIADARGIKVTDEQVAQLATTLDQATKAGEALEVSTAEVATALEQMSQQATAANQEVATAAPAVEEAAKTVEDGALAMAQGFADANEKAAEWGRTIEGLNNDQLLELEEKLRADIEATEELGKSTDELRQRLEETYTKRTTAQDIDRVAGATRKLGDQGKTAAKGLSDLKTAGADVTGVFRGLQAASEGGVRGMFGLVQAGRGLVGLFRTIGTLLAGPVGVGLGVAAAGVAYLGRQARANQTAIEKLFSEAKKGSEDLKKEYTALEAAADKSLEAQIADVKRLADAYQDLIGRMDEAEQRNAKIHEAEAARRTAQLARDEAIALGKATTPQEREKVTKKFADEREALQRASEDGALVNQRLASEVRIANAREVISQQQRRIDAARLDAQLKRAAADAARDNSRLAITEFGGSSRTAHDALRAAQAAAREAELAETTRDRVTVEASSAIEVASKQLQMADDIQKLVSLQAEALQYQREAAVQVKKNEINQSTAIAGVQAGIGDTAARKKQLEDALLRRPGLSTDPANADITTELRAVNEQLTKQNNELLALQTANARDQAELRKKELVLAQTTKRELDQAKRQTANARSTAD